MHIIIRTHLLRGECATVFINHVITIVDPSGTGHRKKVILSHYCDDYDQTPYNFNIFLDVIVARQCAGGC